MFKKGVLIFLLLFVGCIILASLFLIQKMVAYSPFSRAPEILRDFCERDSALGVVSSTVFKSQLKKPDVHFGILMYHQVTDHPPRKQQRFAVSPQIFEQQIKFLIEKGYTFVTVDQALDLFTTTSTPPDKTLALTFDDGYRSLYTTVFPILKKYNIPATAYIITQDIGHSGSLTWDMLRELSASGLVEIGAHTVNHISLKSLSVDAGRFQLAESKRILEATLQKPVTTAAYPFGLYNATTKKIAEEVGFKGAVGIFSGDRPTSTQKFAWRRVGITNRDVGQKLLLTLYSAFEIVK